MLKKLIHLLLLLLLFVTMTCAQERPFTLTGTIIGRYGADGEKDAVLDKKLAELLGE